VLAYDLDGQALPAEAVKKLSVTIHADRIVIRPKVNAQRLPTVKGGQAKADVQFTLDEGRADRRRSINWH